MQDAISIKLKYQNKHAPQYIYVQVKEHTNNTPLEIDAKISIFVYVIFVKMIFLSKTNQKPGSRNKSGSQPIRSHLSSILALRAGLFPNKPSLFPIETQRLRWWKARLLLRASVVEFVGSHLSYFSARSATSHPTLYHTSTLCCCLVHGFNGLVAFQRCPRS